MRLVGYGLAIGLLGLVALVVRNHPLWPGSTLPGAQRLELATEPGKLIPWIGCPTAALGNVRFVVLGDRAAFVDPDAGTERDVVWPSGFSAWRFGDRAVLVTRNGTFVALDGQVFGDGLGGGEGVDRAFHVCISFN